ncbi:hypothetical protein B0T14DRAFT_343139 [Immersiella caudata]|uniref:Uncharacterized protein n=1 Tax=Immersiella caudata TaxID=314043 RepID=A0AA39U272_9PEZI|nr:hypothetical protein B0T14DRAFT_343139 [Immersiella caudata]
MDLTERCHEISKLPLDHFLTDVCAEVARFLIIAWTYQVTIMKWPGEARLDYPFETRNGKTTRLMDVESIKDVCALGGYSTGHGEGMGVGVTA